jgi:hypothetical protein
MDCDFETPFRKKWSVFLRVWRGEIFLVNSEGPWMYIGTVIILENA